MARHCINDKEGHGVLEDASRLQKAWVQVNENPDLTGPLAGWVQHVVIRVSSDMHELRDTTAVEEHHTRLVDLQCCGKSLCKMTHQEPKQKH